METTGTSRGCFPLAILIRAYLLQAWRKLGAVREQSRLLSSVIGLFLAGYAFISFFLFYKALRFVQSFPGLGTLLTERLIFLLFAFLFILLLFSNVVISYTNLFRNRETSFLLALPIPTQTVFRWKLLESALLASWAFLFLIAPLLAAYGLTYNVPWHFYLFTLGLLGLFIVIPAVAGAWVSVSLARFMDRRAFQISAVILVLAGVISAVFWLQPEAISDEMLETRVLTVLDQLLMKTRFSQFPFLPSYWLSSGLLHWSEGALASAFFFAMVLLSYVLLFGFLAFTRTGTIFYDGMSKVQSRGSLLANWGWFRNWRGGRQMVYPEPGLLERALAGLVPIRADVRALLLKDARLFWRDTAQWGQTLVLFGLLGVYIINLRHFSHQLSNPFWVNLVSFLNLGACSLNLATLTTRFVYPQFSLEGKRLWIVGLAPLGLVRVLQTKFALASAASLAVTLGLILLSCQMLGLPWERTLYFAFSVTIMTFSLNALAMGLGALYPNLKEDHPGKIVSGFGGTFCLVLSFLYIVAAVILLAIGSPWDRLGQWNRSGMAAGWTGFALLSLVLGWLPFKLGLRKVRHFEI
jgi:ABC-2 type transport system permease protein